LEIVLTGSCQLVRPRLFLTLPPDFRNAPGQLYEHLPQLVSPWHALRDVRAQRRAVEWLLDQGLIDENSAEKFAADHPEPGLP